MAKSEAWRGSFIAALQTFPVRRFELLWSAIFMLITIRRAIRYYVFEQEVTLVAFT